MEARAEPLPSIGVGAVITLVLGLVLGILSRSIVGVDEPSFGQYLVAVAEGLIFPMLGMLFVVPGEAEEPLFARRSS